MATNQAELDQLLAGLSTEVQSLGSDLDTAFADFAAKVAAGTPPADLTAEATQVQAAIDAIKGFEAKAKAADPGASPATPPAAPTPTSGS